MRFDSPVVLFHRRPQPSFDVEQRPLARHVLADSPQHKRVVDIVEEPLDRLPTTTSLGIRSK